MCACVCVCVHEARHNDIINHVFINPGLPVRFDEQNSFVCVCVCVCEGEPILGTELPVFYIVVVGRQWVVHTRREREREKEP